jgi:adenosylcobinamide-GDP ribazoletransferase
VTAALALAAWVILTRALHLDGWMDTCDGLFGGFTAERRLEIMRDSRAGAFGVAGGVLILLIKYAALAALPDRMVGLLLAPTLGRWAMAVALIGCPYGRAEGLGRDVKDHTGRTQATLATATALIAAWLIAGWGGVIGLALAGVGTLVGAWFILRLIPGLTGDTYGAICEGIEALSLLFFATETALWAS